MVWPDPCKLFFTAVVQSFHCYHDIFLLCYHYKKVMHNKENCILQYWHKYLIKYLHSNCSTGGSSCKLNAESCPGPDCCCPWLHCKRSETLFLDGHSDWRWRSHSCGRMITQCNKIYTYRLLTAYRSGNVIQSSTTVPGGAFPRFVKLKILELIRLDTIMNVKRHVSPWYNPVNFSC
jgi:hypothetical protein